MRESAGVVLASNRGPVSFVATDDGFDIKRGAGGLAGAMDPVASRLGEKAVWIAAATSDTDRRALAEGAAEGLAERLGYSVHLIDIDPDTYARYYDVVSNRMLWFASHCLFEELDIPPFGNEELAAWQGAYEEVNARFARAVLQFAGPDDLILLQDYHLATAPAHVREARPEAAVFHFTHSSFAPPRCLERLPHEVAQGVVRGLLGADLLGFHVAPWVSNFLDCCEARGARVDRDAGMVEARGRRTWVRAYPIPIDAGGLRERAAGEAARRWRAELAGQVSGPMIVRADRTEPSKNIVRGFEAYGVVLDRRPDLAGTAFVACLYPSRQSMPEYRRYAEEIQAVVDKVTARHPNSIKLFLKDDYDRTLGALCEYDVLLVNPLMDGMNLVSKEGAALNERDGVLVLSSGAGSFEELGAHAVTVDDARLVEATADALERALELDPATRSKQAGALRAIVDARLPEDWIKAQIQDLAAVQAGGEPATAPSAA